MQKKIMLIAGEASGDIHAAAVVNALKKMANNFSFNGVAGPAMRESGVEELVHLESIAVMGFIEVIAHFKVIYAAYQKIKHAFKTNPPDVLILIDYPGFNLRIAKLAKEFAIPVLYYVSPQIWAWKKGRIKKIKRYVDKMAVIFPFEVDFYAKAGVPVKYVGSPIAEMIHCDLTQIAARAELDLMNHWVVGLLPGSRHLEIKRMLPTLLLAAKKLREKYPLMQFVLPLASTLTADDVMPYIKETPVSILIVEKDTQVAIRACDAAICTSGTVTLETALLGTPLVIVYKMAPISYQIIKRLITIPYVGLCNIVAQKKAAVELIQAQASPENIAAEIEKLLEHPGYQQQQLMIFSELKQTLNEKNAAKEVANLVMELLAEAARKITDSKPALS